MKITVTGGRGFIGSHVADIAEAEGHEVRFFDKRDGNDILGSLEKLQGSDAVIHLAGILGTAELFDDIEGAIEMNTVGSYRVADWCATHGAQYTGILVPDVFPSIYCATKVGAQRITTALHHAKGLKVSHVIAYNAHGPGQAYGPGHPQKFGPTFSIAAWNDRPIPIWGDGSQLVDPVAVRDVARMLVDATQHDDDVVFDGGTGITVTVTEIAEFVLKVTGSNAGIEYLPMRIGETKTNVAAAGRGWERLSWVPRFSWEYLRETIEWYRGKDYEVQSGLRGVKAVLYTALYGPYDWPKPAPKVDCPTIFYTDSVATAEEAVRQGWWEARVVNHGITTVKGSPAVVAPMMAHKWWKLHPEIVAPDAEVSLWLDASIEVTIPDYLQRCIDALGDDDFGCVPHPARRCIFPEAYFSATLHWKYDAPSIHAQAEHYHRFHPENWGLFATGANIRRHTPAVIELCHQWWDECLNWSHQDQLSLPVLLRIHEDNVRWNTNLPWFQWWHLHEHGVR